MALRPFLSRFRHQRRPHMPLRPTSFPSLVTASLSTSTLELNWSPPQKAPIGFYSDIENQKLFFRWAEAKLGLSKREDWYKVATQRLCEIGGESLMKKHSYSMHKAMSTVYPDHPWLPWLFVPITTGLWKSADIKERYIKWLSDQIGINKLEDWYDVTQDQLKEFGGDRMIATEYEGSLPKMLKAIYPEHSWHPWLFKRVAQNFWSDQSNQRQYLDWLHEELQLRSMDDWYQVTVRSVREKGGGTLLWYYGDSLVAALFYVYPEHSWDLLRYHKMPQNFWSTPKRRRLFFDWIGRQLGVNELQDWYSVSPAQIEALGQTHKVKIGLLRGRFSSLGDALREVYPDHQWDTWRFQHVPSPPIPEVHDRPS